MTGRTLSSHRIADGGNPIESFPWQDARVDKSIGEPGRSAPPRDPNPAVGSCGKNGFKAESVRVGTCGIGMMGRAPPATTAPTPTDGNGARVGKMEGNPVPVAFNNEFKMRVFSSMSDWTKSTFAAIKSGFFFSSTITISTFLSSTG